MSKKPKLKFHHIGIATNSLKDEIIHYSLLGYKMENNIFKDSIQGVKGCFMTKNSNRIELLENLPKSNKLKNLTKEGSNIYHTAYLTNNIYSAINFLISNKNKLIVSPVKSIAFNNRLICFLINNNKIITELISTNE